MIVNGYILKNSKNSGAEFRHNRTKNIKEFYRRLVKKYKIV